jgi:hypothetical protein
MTSQPRRKCQGESGWPYKIVFNCHALQVSESQTRRLLFNVSNRTQGLSGSRRSFISFCTCHVNLFRVGNIPGCPQKPLVPGHLHRQVISISPQTPFPSRTPQLQLQVTVDSTKPPDVDPSILTHCRLDPIVLRVLSCHHTPTRNALHLLRRDPTKIRSVRDGAP